MTKSTYLAQALHNHVNGNTPYSPPTEIWVGVSVGSPGPTGGSLAEPVGNGYSRVLVSAWTDDEGRASSNEAEIVFPDATGSWATPTYGVRFDAETGGNMLDYGPISNAQAIVAGNRLRIPVGGLVITDTTP